MRFIKEYLKKSGIEGQMFNDTFALLGTYGFLLFIYYSLFHAEYYNHLVLIPMALIIFVALMTGALVCCAIHYRWGLWFTIVYYILFILSFILVLCAGNARS